MIKIILYALIGLASIHSVQAAQGYQHLIGHPTAPPNYRKVALNGSIDQDLNPLNRKHSDSEPETTYVDALTLDLRHSVTDIYVTFLEDYLPLEVRRNWQAERFQAGAHTNTPAPFGPGWTSGIGNYLQITELSESIVEAFLLDEQGIAHHFMAIKRARQALEFFPIADTGHHQDARRMQLRESSNGGYVFTKPYGTELTFEPLPSEDRTATFSGASNTPRIFRCIQTIHPSGVELTYHYAYDNLTTIPHEISFDHCRITIETNADGRITRIVDPRGYGFNYNYERYALGDNDSCQALVRVFKPMIDGKRSFTSYDYEVKPLSGTEATWQISLSQIRDARGQAHHFSYQDDSRARNAPRRVIDQIELPGIQTKTSFASEWLTSEQENYVATRIVNTLGIAQAIEFRAWTQNNAQTQFPEIPSLDAYTRILTKRYNKPNVDFDTATGQLVPQAGTELLCVETYVLDPSANFSIREAIDMSGAATKYIYNQALAESLSLNPRSQHSPQHYGTIDQVIDALGNTTTFTYGEPFHQETSRIDAEGRVRQYERDPVSGEITQYTIFADTTSAQKDQAIYQEVYHYEDERFPGFKTQKIVKQLNQTEHSPEWERDLITLYEADEFGRTARVIGSPEELIEITAYQYNLNGSRSVKTYRNGYTELSTYDGYNQLREVFFPADQRSMFIEKDERGNDLEIHYIDGNVREMEYDSLSRLIKETTITAETVTEVSRGYNAINSLLYEKNNGVLTEYSYDPLGRVIQIKTPEETTEYKYDSPYSSSWLFEESEMKPSWAYTVGTSPYTLKYDALQRVVSTHQLINGQSEQTGQYGYDKVGNQTFKIENGERTEYTYDAMNRLILEKQPDGTEIKHLYSSTNLHYGTSLPDGSYQLKIFDAVGDEVTLSE